MRRKKKKNKNINIYSENDEIIYSGIVEEIPIKDESVLALSIKYYDNHEPCMIIRSAVLSNIYMQFFDVLDKSETSEILFKDLPEELQEYVQI